MASGRAFWITNRLANPALRRLLRTSAGRRLGQGLMVLRYTGTVSGRPRELVVHYARDGDTVWVWVGGADRKTWWHNLRRPADVELWLAGEHLRARAVVVAGRTDLDQARAGLVAYRHSVPRGPRVDPETATLVRAEIIGSA
jgi:hypothetical protein